MTILADHFFIYLIVPENWPISTPVRPVMDIIDCKQDLFVYIITERYTFKEFYGVIIDTSTFKKFTAGYKQYFVYKTTVNGNTDINTI